MGQWIPGSGVQAAAPVSPARPPWASRVLARTLRRALQPHVTLGIGLLALLVVLILAPVASLVHATFTVQLMDIFRIPGAQLGDFTLHHWQRILSNQHLFLEPLRNTLMVGLGTAVLALVIGTGLAWLVSRTDVLWKPVIAALAVIPYILPSWALALPWAELFQNRGVRMPPGFLEYYTGLQAPEWLVFGPLPIIVVMGLHYFPFVFLMVSSALANLDAQMEEAGELLGASRWHILRTVTVPAVTPAIFGALILAFSRTIGTFGTPALLGPPAGFTVLPVQIRSFMTMNLAPQAYILALLLVAVSILFLYLNDRVVGRRKSFATIGGKGVRHRLLVLGRSRWQVTVLVVAILSAVVVSPLLLLLWTSFMRLAGDYGLANFTLHYWSGLANPAIASGEPGILRNPKLWASTANSLRVAFLGGLVCALLGMLIGYVMVRARGTWLARMLDRLSFLPTLIPSIAFGAIYLSLFSVARGPLPALYGTLLLLVLAVIGKQLPFTTRTGVSAMHQIAGELEEAAEVSGATWQKRFRSIIWPLARSGFIAGFLIVFITTMRELSLFVLLMSPRSQVLATLTFEYAQIGSRQLSSALMSFLVLLTFVVVGLSKLYERYTAARTRVGG